MSGILDKKSRIIDAILTEEGRRQMAEGTYSVSYVTFSDAGVAYESDSVEGHVDPTNRIYFEACNLPQDKIVFEADDSGNIYPLRPDDITVESFKGNLQGNNALAFISDGKLFAKERQYGARIKLPGLMKNKSDAGSGFIYSDHTRSLTASITIDPNSPSHYYSASPSGYIGVIGTKNNLPSSQFASQVTTIINSLTDMGGPAVSASYIDEYVHISYNTYPTVLMPILKLTGSLSSPIELTSFAIGGRDAVEEIEAQNFASQITGILTSSLDNFTELMTLSTVDTLVDDSKFELSSTNIVFDVEKIRKDLLASASGNPSLDEIDSLFNDDKMSHLANFSYLPPIVKVSDNVIPDKSNLDLTRRYFLGNYPSWGDNERVLSLEKLNKHYDDYSSTTSIVNFVNTSNKNNLLCQMFEVADGQIKKLDIVEFHNPENIDYKSLNRLSLYGTEDKIFFLGKTFKDSRGTTCFVNMFTITFSSRD